MTLVYEKASEVCTIQGISNETTDDYDSMQEFQMFLPISKPFTNNRGINSSYSIKHNTSIQTPTFHSVTPAFITLPQSSKDLFNNPNCKFKLKDIDLKVRIKGFIKFKTV